MLRAQTLCGSLHEPTHLHASEQPTLLSLSACPAGQKYVSNGECCLGSSPAQQSADLTSATTHLYQVQKLSHLFLLRGAPHG